jgi:hypothetical protein
MSDGSCSAGECNRQVYKDALCRGHYERRRRGQPLTPLRPAQGGPLGAKDPYDRFKDACFAYEDAVDSDDVPGRDRAWSNLLDAAEWVVLGVPKIPRLQRLGYQLLSELRAKMRDALKGNEAPNRFASHGESHRVHR